MRRPTIRLLAAVGAVGAALVASACAPTEHVGGAASSNLAISYTATSFSNDFNLLSPTNSSVPPGEDLVYETLIRLSPTNGFIPQPWLAKSWTWSDGGLTLTWNLRAGVTWSDGTPLTSADVAYTLGLQKDAALVQGNPGPITSIDTPDPLTVIVHYSVPSYSTFDNYYGVHILPKHIWEHEDPSTWTNPDPVGTGPFTLEHFGLQAIIYKLRPGYWGGEGHGVKTVTYDAAGTPNVTLQALQTGSADYSQSSLVGNPIGTFVASSPSTNHFLLPSPGAGEGMLFNNAVAPTGNVDIRQALYYALNAAQLVTLTPGNYNAPANITGLNEPAYTQWVAPQFRGKVQKQNPSLAQQYLAKSGYRVQGGTLVKGGKAYPLTLKYSPGSDPDWQDGIAGDIKQVLGINVSLNASQSNQNDDECEAGTYTLCLGPDTPGQSAESGITWDVAAPAPVGKNAASNWSRANSPAAQALSAQMAATDDVSQQQAAAYKIEQIIVDQRFTAPIAAYAWPESYTTKHWTGWPSPTKPDAVPADGRGDLILTILNLRPA